MKRVLLALSSLLLSAFAAGAAGNCLTDTSQTDFQAGQPVGVDLTTSSGNVLLGSSSSGGNVDQENLTYTAYGDEFNTSQWLAQTFTPNVSGSLTRVDVNFFCGGCSGTPPAVTVSIRATSAGLPVGSDLASATIPTFSPIGGTFKFYSANFATPANLTAHTQYAIVVRLASAYAGGLAYFTDSALGGFTGNDVYAGGGMLISTNSGGSWTPRILIGNSKGIDAVFITYMGSGSGGGYVSSGNLTSSVKDSSPGTGSTNWSTLAWTNSLPTGTAVKFQVAASNSSTGTFTFVGPDGTAGSYFTTTNAPLSQFNGNRYLKYRAYLSTSSSTATPILNDATACYSTVGTADLSITNTDGATTDTPGTPVTYTITASNPAGSSTVTGATVTDTFPQTLSACAWTCTAAAGGTCPVPASGSGNISSLVNLAGGSSVTFTATCAIAASATGTLSNTASITAPASVNDPNAGNNSATDTTTLAAAADLTITNSDGISTANPGGSVTYTITASNPGPSSVTGATVTDTFPPSLTCNWTCSGTGTCAASGSGNISSLVNLPGGASVTYSATCSIAASATGSLSNTASITAPAGVNDPNTANNNATDTDSLVAKTTVRLTITDNLDAAQLGDVLTYVISITNAGPSDAGITGISDSLPVQLAGTSWTCGGTGGATCKAVSGNSMLNNQTATVPAGGTVTYLYTATVTNDNAMDQFTNTATAIVSAGDPNPNKSASDTDRLVVFLNGFEGGQPLAMPVAVTGGSGDSFAVQLGVDAGLLNQLGSAPLTIASGHSANGKDIFSVQLVRLGRDIAARTLTRVGDGVFRDVSPWRTVDLKQHVLGLAWQSASARGGDGYLNVATGNSQISITGHDVKEPVTQLQVAVKNDIPWLVPIDQ